MLNEIESQETDLIRYVSYMKNLGIEKVKPEDTVLCGAGDSLACVKFTERLMKFRLRAFDPYDILLYPNAIRNKRVFFVSVSGKTRANILAAKSARHHGAKETIAITANPDSELARSCSRLIELKFSKYDGLTPGTNSFTTSILACATLFKNLEMLNVKGMI